MKAINLKLLPTRQNNRGRSFRQNSNDRVSIRGKTHVTNDDGSDEVGCTSNDTAISCIKCALPLLLLVGSLVFVSAFFALFGHLSLDEIGHIDLHVRVNHPDSRYASRTADTSVQSKTTTHSPYSQVDRRQKSPIDSYSAYSNHDNVVAGWDRVRGSHRSACQVAIRSSCSVNPYVKYWDDQSGVWSLLIQSICL